MIETAEKLIEKLYSPVGLEFVTMNTALVRDFSEIVFTDKGNKMYVVSHRKQMYYTAVYQLDGYIQMFSDDAVKEMLDGNDSEKTD